MPTSTLLNLPQEIEKLVSERSLLKHPFYQAWSKGKLTKEQLAGYAKEYYFAAKNVPVVMEAISKNLPRDASPRVRETFAKHAEEEHEHIELWERFASALGVTEKELEKYEPTETVKGAVASIVEAASEGFEEGIAAMYAFECDLPAISKSKIEGLVKFYGFDPTSPSLRPVSVKTTTGRQGYGRQARLRGAGRLTAGDLKMADAHAYFEEHLEEEKHLCFWRELLRKVDAEKREAALASAKATVAAQNRVLDGVVGKYCPELACGCREV